MREVAEARTVRRKATHRQVEADDGCQPGRQRHGERVEPRALHPADLRLGYADRAGDVGLSNADREACLAELGAQLVKQARGASIGSTDHSLAARHAPSVRIASYPSVMWGFTRPVTVHRIRAVNVVRLEAAQWHRRIHRGTASADLRVSWSHGLAMLDPPSRPMNAVLDQGSPRAAWCAELGRYSRPRNAEAAAWAAFGTAITG